MKFVDPRGSSSDRKRPTPIAGPRLRGGGHRVADAALAAAVVDFGTAACYKRPQYFETASQRK